MAAKARVIQMTPEGGRLKHCYSCDEWKSASQFHRQTNRCKKCDNAKPKTPSADRRWRTKTYHQARAELARRHPREFEELLDAIRAGAQPEEA